MSDIIKQIVEITNVDTEGNITNITYPQTVPAAIIGLQEVISDNFKGFIKVYKLSVSGSGSNKIILPEINGYMPFELISMSGLDFKSTGIAKDINSDSYVAEISNVIEIGASVSYKCVYIVV